MLPLCLPLSHFYSFCLIIRPLYHIFSKSCRIFSNSSAQKCYILKHNLILFIFVKKNVLEKEPKPPGKLLEFYSREFVRTLKFATNMNCGVEPKRNIIADKFMWSYSEGFSFNQIFTEKSKKWKLLILICLRRSSLW